MNSPAPRFWWPTLWSTTATTALVTIHHVFRLGPELIVPGLLLVALPILLLLWMRARGSLLATGLLGALVALMFFWFGIVDGVIDHVFKAVGLEHVTLLPGGGAEVVATYYSLGSTSASAAFYEGTGVVQAVASMVMLGVAAALVASQVTTRRRGSGRVADPRSGTSRARTKRWVEQGVRVRFSRDPHVRAATRLGLARTLAAMVVQGVTRWAWSESRRVGAPPSSVATGPSWVVPLVLDDAGGHEGSVAAACTAAVRAVRGHGAHPAWEPWRHRRAVSVLRAAPRALDGVARLAAQHDAPRGYGRTPSGRALVLAPARPELLPEPLVSLPSGEITRPRHGLVPTDRGLALVVSTELSTTAAVRAAVQAASAWASVVPSDELDAWSADVVVAVHVVPPRDVVRAYLEHVETAHHAPPVVGPSGSGPSVVLLPPASRRPRRAR
ncbi:hypothetical protein [Oerskovia flava]|uniref:hypothetical protein n=1 Tax=Oerskovia flava TaxID=2986422 RepID=UPI00223EA788|nr:hypothetical protein [Oerskovia sp. JB1-3-2]